MTRKRPPSAVARPEGGAYLRAAFERSRDAIYILLGRSPDGRRLGISMASDVTERRRAEEEIRLQAAALNSAADAVVIMGRDYVIEWVNPAFTRSSGYQAAEAVGRKPRELLDAGVHPESFFREIEDTIGSGKVWRGEITSRRKDGTLYPEALTITPVSHDGETAHFVAIKQDLTELRRLEAQYMQAQKMETVGRLAGGIAHDFNNQLTVIIGRTELLAKRLAPDDPMRPGLDQVREAGEHAASLTRQLLAFSRKQILQPAVIDLGRLTLDWRAVLERLMGALVELVIVAPEDVCYVNADPGQIEQVILNLAVNARDAMPEGGTLRIEVCEQRLTAPLPSTQLQDPLPAGRYVTLSVRDTGSGMDEETRAHAFEPFFTTKGLAGGSGLGLSTVYGIVRQSGGEIQVESRLGVGTTFTIYLPRVEAEPEPEMPRPDLVSGARDTQTVLLVEDEEALRELAQSVLESAGYTVLAAGSGRQALERLSEHPGPVHLIFSDVVLPGMSGRQLAEQIATTRPAARMLFTSGYTDDARLRHGVHDSSASFLAKPYTAAQLLKKVRDVLAVPE